MKLPHMKTLPVVRFGPPVPDTPAERLKMRIWSIVNAMDMLADGDVSEEDREAVEWSIAQEDPEEREQARALHLKNRFPGGAK
jgi:hypothetical protein